MRLAVLVRGEQSGPGGKGIFAVAVGDCVITVVVGDDHPVVRAGLVHLLTSSGGIVVVAEADDGPGLVEMIAVHRPAVALSDFRMPGLDGAAVAETVRRRGIPTRVLVLSAYTEPAIMFRCIERGAAGFLSKDADRATIVAAIHTAADGVDVLPDEFVPALMEQVRHRRTSAATIDLSPREQQILTAIAAGKSAPSIALTMHLAPSTVKTYLQRLYEKLGVNDRGAAVAEAMRRGILQ